MKSGAGVVVLVGTIGVLLNADSCPVVALPPSGDAIVLRSLARSLATLLPLWPIVLDDETDDDDGPGEEADWSAPVTRSNLSPPAACWNWLMPGCWSKYHCGGTFSLAPSADPPSSVAGSCCQAQLAWLSATCGPDWPARSVGLWAMLVGMAAWLVELAATSWAALPDEPTMPGLDDDEDVA